MKSIKKAYCDYLNTPRGAEVYRDFKRILYGAKDSLVETLNNRVLQHLPIVQQEDVKVCDIGGGDGARVTQILGYLHDKFHVSFHLDFVEQSGIYVSAFQSRKLRPCCKVVKFHAYFEDVSLTAASYDLVLLIHSIFAFENGKAIRKMLSLSRTGGATVVVSNAPDSFLGGLKQLIDVDYQDDRYEVNDLLRDLSEQNITFTEKGFSTRWAIQDGTDDLDVLLEWISLGAFAAFPEERKKRIAEYIAANSTRDGNRLFFKENEVVVLIPQQETVGE